MKRRELVSLLGVAGIGTTAIASIVSGDSSAGNPRSSPENSEPDRTPSTDAEKSHSKDSDLKQDEPLTAPTVEQGETATISIEATNLTGLYISEFPEEFGLSKNLTLGDAKFTPSPEMTFERYPPHWQFSGQDIEGEVPIKTAPETPPATYRFEFAFETSETEETRYKETIVTVKGESSC